MKVLLLILFFLSTLVSQFTIYKGNDYLRFAGNVSVYYNNRLYDINDDNFKKDRFGLKDARFQIKGELRKSIKYQIEVDFAKFKGDTYIDEIEEIIDGDLSKITEKMEFESFLVDAYASIKIPKIKARATFGFFKVPFSRNSLGRSKDSPWIDRADLIEDALNRRDLGIMFTSSPFNFNQLEFNIGIFNGRGDITKNNDASGSLEYIARIDYTFGLNFKPIYGKLILPGKLKISDRIDFRRTPIPTIGFGVSYRYADKEENIVYDDDHLWPLSVDGLKKTAGIDLGLMYKGFSMHLDVYSKQITPNNPAMDTAANILDQYGNPTGEVIDGQDGIITSDDTISDSYDLWNVTEYSPTFDFGGTLLHLNYYFKKIDLVASLRWEEINPNSLIQKNWNTNLGFGLCYMLDGMNTAIKLQYIHRLPKGNRIGDYSLSQFVDNVKNDFNGNLNHKPWKESEFRIGIQFLIR